ncbi:N-acetylmuramoyl-L-alanine amidase [Bacillus sp. J14TS2]|uniref:N-acetylmuramoyl-L-alanine amidase family protein n=1 Tax=Bacillus sp. J14TS2 TaxID=2807188 RepID=UPI001FD1506E|nr:N-acetylmuramoyl-L-alanine amidase [Bacillus sp. J14TS2]
MKLWKVFVLIMILLLVFAVTHLFKVEKNEKIAGMEGSKTTKAEKKLPLEERVIVLDPGHGGNDVGASGQNGTLEKLVTLETANKIKITLEQAGAEVQMTRDDDEYVELEERVELAAENQADLFVSIHYDAFETNDIEGMTSYYYHKRDQKLAECIHQHIFMEDIHARDRGVSFGNYYVLRENKVPAVLLELGYISNAEDETRINSAAFQEKVATGIVDGIKAFFDR